MIRKYIIAIGVITIVICGSLLFFIRYGGILRPKPGITFSTAQLNDAMEKAGGQEILGKEATEAISRIGSQNHANSWELTNCPAIARMAALIGGEIVGMSPSGGGVPAHVSIRRGAHFDYQFIYVFGAGSTPNDDGLIPVGGSVYLRNTAPTR